MNESTTRAADEAVAAEVRAAMARKRVTQGKLAGELGWTQAYVSRRLNGRASLSIGDLSRIAEALDVTVSSLASAADRNVR